eukprot:5915066-Amphidinium_carterae.1
MVSDPCSAEEELGYLRDHTLHLCSNKERRGREDRVLQWRCDLLSHALPVHELGVHLWEVLAEPLQLPAEFLGQDWSQEGMRVLGLTSKSRDSEWMKVLVSSLFRKVGHKGSDVRLATGTLMRPNIFPRGGLCARHLDWKVRLSFKLGGQHINVLELKAVCAGARFFMRTKEHLGSRCLMVSDSQVCLGVLVKGRSSSKSLNYVLRKHNFGVLLSHLVMAYMYIATNQNPADRP